MLRLLMTLCLTLTWTATGAFAQTCGGTDQRPGLNAAETAELAARIAATPYAAGNHWRARKGDKTVHIIGTMHIDDPRHDPIMTRIAPLIDAADLVMVETTPKEEAQLQQAMADKPDLIFITEGGSLIDRLPSEDWRALEAAAAARGIPGFMAAKFQPWYLSLILSMPPCVLAQVQAGKRGLDHRIMDAAAVSGTPLEALDAYDALFRVMGADPLDQQIAYLKLGILPEAVTLNSITTLSNSYFEEKPAEVFEVSRVISHRHIDLPRDDLNVLFDQMMARLLDDRNALWLPRINAADAKQIVVAVGAGHLPGTGGLLRLLEKDGWSLERQPF